MKDTVYLVFDRGGVTSMRKSLPKLGSGQHAVAVRLTVPDSAFSRPYPVAEVTVPESALISPVVEVVGMGPP